jgi:glucose-6-phosphate isomerase
MDLIAPVNGSSPMQRQHDLALANCLAQAEAFAFGQSEAQVRADLAASGMPAREMERLAPHRVHPGNRPGSLILFPRLEARSLGRLLAWYEHKVYVQSVIWDVNPFDQWGVELGKKLAATFVPVVESGDVAAQPKHLGALFEHVHRWRSSGV